MESKQIQELEKLLEEYRGLLSTGGQSKGEELAKVSEEKEQLARQVANMSRTIDTLKTQLELAAAKVLQTR